MSHYCNYEGKVNTKKMNTKKNELTNKRKTTQLISVIIEIKNSASSINISIQVYIDFHIPFRQTSSVLSHILKTVVFEMLTAQHRSSARCPLISLRFHKVRP